MARRILLADDSVTAQNMGRKILSDAGYEVITVNNGSAALKKIAEQKPDLIVLDVYMPGYSGLEVCQRIKDTRETSRIPILLTVGKLEPFKPEEARRAKADAYIVKPFEASELLVALTKLEDKIVPTAEPYKPGRFAKAIAAVERFNHEEPQESFGDKDSGWKARIKFPSPGARPAEVEPEEAAGKKSLRDDVEVPTEPSRAFERPIPEGLPKDITPEEIEAITAAAAQFGESGKPASSSQEMTPEPIPHAQPASGAQETEPATAAVSHARESSDDVPQSSTPFADEAEHREEAAPVTFANSTQETSEAEHVSASGPALQDEQVRGEAASEEQSTTEVVAQDQFSGRNGDDLQTPEAVSELNPASHGAGDASGVAQPDSEVAAALQNLAPPNGNRADQVAVEQPVGQMAGPRWIAESVSLESHETAVALENEMHKAFAAFAAAEAAGTTFADAASSSESSHSHAGSSYIDRAAEEPPDSPPQVSPADHYSDAQGTPATEVGEQVSPVPEITADVPPSAIAETPFAGEQTETPASVETSAAERAPEASTLPTDEANQPEETAARATAWENWQHVRDAVADSTANVAEAAAAALADSTSEELPAKTEAMAAAAGAGNSGSSSAPENDSTVASIVDSVLAELKPKLMEEIAKKMKKDQK